MKNLFVWFCVAFFIVGACIVSYRIGFTQGAASCPIKYAICDNGTCVLSDKAPAARVLIGE